MSYVGVFSSGSKLSKSWKSVPHYLCGSVTFYASSVTPHIWPWFPNSCLYLILEVFDIDLCSMECYSPRPRMWKVTFRVLGRGEWLSMLWDLGFCKCQHSQFTYSLLIKRNLTIFERVPMPQLGFEPGTPHIVCKCSTNWAINAYLI